MQQRIGVFFAVVFLIFSASCWKLIQELPHPPLGQSELGLGFFPAVCVITIAVLALLLLVRSFLFPLDKASLPSPIGAEGLRRMTGILLLMTGYAVGYEWLGFYASTWFFGASGLYVINERRPLILLLYPALLVGFVYLGFVTILGVVLPEGDLFSSLFMDKV